MELTTAEKERYARHIILPQIGLEGQLRLKSAKVLVVGAGGLGSPVLLYLAAAGVGTIGIVDPDTVDASNLQRQVLYTLEDVGQPKVQAAKARLLALNPHLNIQTYQVALTTQNAMDIIPNYDIVADGTDNFPTRYLINDACVLSDTINVYASIAQFEGRLSVFNNLRADGSRGPNYRHMFPEPPPPNSVPNCAEGGVLGVLPGILGSLQASEVIKIITGVGQPLDGRMLFMDVATMNQFTLEVNETASVSIKELINYEAFCNFGKNLDMSVKEITVEEYKALVADNADFQLIDVREVEEFNQANLNGELIPLGEVLNNIDKISKDKQVVVHCRSGKRSAMAIMQLQQADSSFDNLYNLRGGILAVLS